MASLSLERGAVVRASYGERGHLHADQRNFPSHIASPTVELVARCNQRRRPVMASSSNVRHAVARSTGATTWTRKEGDDGWKIDCLSHSAATSAPNRGKAWTTGAHPEQWCPKCKAIAAGKGEEEHPRGDSSAPDSGRQAHPHPEEQGREQGDDPEGIVTVEPGERLERPCPRWPECGCTGLCDYWEGPTLCRPSSGQTTRPTDPDRSRSGSDHVRRTASVFEARLAPGISRVVSNDLCP